jgi:hypothetical protein
MNHAYLTVRPDANSAQTASNSGRVPADVEDAIVAALVAALVADFRRNPMSTGDSPTGTNRQGEAA